MTETEAEKLLNGLMEQLASIEHDRWAHWQRYMHGRAAKQPDGSLLIPPSLWRSGRNNWRRPTASCPRRKKKATQNRSENTCPSSRKRFQTRGNGEIVAGGNEYFEAIF